VVQFLLNTVEGWLGIIKPHLISSL
jgi:hypothetical protein